MNMGRRDLGNNIHEKFSDEIKLVEKFFTKYPEIKYMPVLGPLKIHKGGQMNFSHPASKFVHKQKRLMK